MTNLNPLHILDSILEDWASARVRRTIHSLLLLVAALGGLYLASDGDWLKALVALLALVYTAANRANTEPLGDAYPSFYDGEVDPKDYEGDYDPESDYDLSTEAATFDEPVSGNLPEGEDRY